MALKEVLSVAVPVERELEPSVDADVES
jgi:hypothetical protein